MATAWENYTGMSFSDWQAMTKKPLLDIWEHIKNASDERICFLFGAHLISGAIRTENEFPIPSDFDLLEFTPTELTTISDNIFYSDTVTNPKPVCIKNGTVQTGVSAPAYSSLNSALTNNNSNLPRRITKAECLQDVFSYASGELTFLNDYNNTTNKIPTLKSYIKQMFELLNYPVYYSVPYKGSFLLSTGVSTPEREYVEIDVVYEYDTSATYGDNFISASATATYADASSDNIYTTNDLDESGSTFSTISDMLTLAVGYMNTYFDGTTWDSDPTGFTRDRCSGKSYAEAYATNFSDDIYTYYLRINLKRERLRFKVAQGFRPTSPNKFDYEVYVNDYYEFEASGASEHAFGTGKTDLQLELNEITADGSGWYVIDMPAGFSFSGVDLPSVLTSQEFSETITQDIYRMHPYMNQTTYAGGVLVKPNLTDGTAFEYFTPA